MFQIYFESIKKLVITSSILWTCFWNAFVSLFKLRIILEVDFQNLSIYCQTQNFAWSRLSRLINLHSNPEGLLSSQDIRYSLATSVRNRCGNPLGSAWWRQTKTISKNINSRNEMKVQTSKCHTFSSFLLNQLSLCLQCFREFFLFKYKLSNNFYKLRHTFMRGHTRHQTPEK